MNEEFLTGLGLEKDISDRILKEYNDEKIQTGIAKAFESAGVVDNTAADAMLEKDGLTLENLTERVEALKDAHPALFKTQTPRIVSSAQQNKTIDRLAFDKMSYRERLELFKKNPDTYKKLVE